jgi:hypothetical protein
MTKLIVLWSFVLEVAALAEPFAILPGDASSPMTAVRLTCVAFNAILMILLNLATEDRFFDRPPLAQYFVVPSFTTAVVGTAGLVALCLIDAAANLMPALIILGLAARIAMAAYLWSYARHSDVSWLTLPYRALWDQIRGPQL